MLWCLPYQVHLLDARDPWHSRSRCVQPRNPGLEYFVEHHAGQLYILTNAAGPEYTLMKTPVNTPDRRYTAVSQCCLLPSRPTVVINSLAALHDGAVLILTCLHCSFWNAAVPDRPGIIIEDIDMFHTALVLYERHHGKPAMSILPLDNGMHFPSKMHIL